MDALLFLRVPCELEPVELQWSGTLRGFGASSQSGLRASRWDRTNAARPERV